MCFMAFYSQASACTSHAAMDLKDHSRSASWLENLRERERERERGTAISMKSVKSKLRHFGGPGFFSKIRTLDQKSGLQITNRFAPIVNKLVCTYGKKKLVCMYRKQKLLCTYRKSKVDAQNKKLSS